jgi:hypothetical protein
MHIMTLVLDVARFIALSAAAALIAIAAPFNLANLISKARIYIHSYA